MTEKIKKAVVLKYPEGAEAPFITAKGSGKLAEKIIETAEKNNIKIERNQVMVDLLSSQEIGAAVPEETWQVLAQIFSLILNSKK